MGPSGEVTGGLVGCTPGDSDSIGVGCGSVGWGDSEGQPPVWEVVEHNRQGWSHCGGLSKSLSPLESPT